MLRFSMLLKRSRFLFGFLVLLQGAGLVRCIRLPLQAPAPQTIGDQAHNSSRAIMPVFKFDPAQRKRSRVVISSHGREDGIVVVEQSRTKLFLRAVYLSFVYLLPFITSPLALLVPSFRDHVWYKLLTVSLGHSGAAFIKWGQWASVRPDIFPLKLCDVLSHLHSNAPKHSWKHTRQEVERALGCPLEMYFERFDRQAFASGSIAQVHFATHHGQQLAVKVRHPNVQEQISFDFRIMRAFGSFVDRIPGLHWLNLEASMEQFSHTIASQTRLDVEANHLDIFNDNFNRQSRICGFPKVVFASESVLVETFEDGTLATHMVLPINRAKAQKSSSWWPLRSLAGLLHSCLRCFHVEEEMEETLPSTGHFIVSKGEDMYLQMLLKDNLMHADLHPGNILLQHNNSVHRNPKIILLDAGMVAQLGADEQDNFIGLLKAIGKGDGSMAADFILRFSSNQTCTSPDRVENFRQDMVRLFAQHCRGYGQGVHIGNVLRLILQTLRVHRVRVDVNYVTLVLNILCLEGLASAFQPDYNLLDGARPLLDGYKKWLRFLFPLGLLVKRIKDDRRYSSLREQEAREAAS